MAISSKTRADEKDKVNSEGTFDRARDTAAHSFSQIPLTLFDEASNK